MDGALLPGNASSSESDVSTARNLHDDEVNRWLFSREEIENNSPSRRDGIDWRKEIDLRKSYCTFLQAVGERFELDQVTIGTAIVLCHRFFTRQSHAKNNGLTIATICLLIAGKVEDPQLTTKACIVASHEIRHRTKLDAAERQEVFEQQKEIVLSGEKLVLSTLNFDFSVCHPYEHLSKAINKFAFEDAKPLLSRLTLNFVKSCLQTTLYLQYKPHHIAAAAFFISAQHIKLDIQSYGRLFRQEFDVTLSQLKDIHDQMQELCDKKPIDTPQGDIVGSSDGGDAVHQPVSRDMDTTDEYSSSSVEGVLTKVNPSQSDDHSDHDGSRPEGIGEKNTESEAEENRDVEISDDVGVSQLEKDLQLHDGSRPEVIGEKNSESEAGENQDVETSDDVGVSQLEKDLELHEEEVKTEPEKDEKSFD